LTDISCRKTKPHHGVFTANANAAELIRPRRFVPKSFCERQTGEFPPGKEFSGRLQLTQTAAPEIRPDESFRRYFIA
jgi:hypothetical protein